MPCACGFRYPYCGVASLPPPHRYESQMCSLESLKIDLNGLKAGATAFRYDLGDAYFGFVDSREISHGCVQVQLDVTRIGDSFTLEFSISGVVTVSCDRCLDDMEQPINTSGSIVAQLGDESSDAGDIVMVDSATGILDVSWTIYEFIALAIPVRHVHAPGRCNPAMIKALEEHSAVRGGEESAGPVVDTRWKELEKLKTILKD